MAAGGWKIFTPGDVLTADDTMDYLQQGVLVFDSSGARGSAIAAPAEGQFSYLKDTDATEYYDGAAWTPVAQGGLVHIVTESFSAVSSVSLDNCFSGDYDNYRVLVSFTPSASGQTFDLRIRAAGTDLTSSVYSYAGVQVTTGGVVSGLAALAITNMRLSATASTNSRHATVFDIFTPNAAIEKTVSFSSWRANGTSAAFVEQGAGFIASAVAHDGFSLSISSGTISGTVSVYGYKK